MAKLINEPKEELSMLSSKAHTLFGLLERSFIFLTLEGSGAISKEIPHHSMLQLKFNGILNTLIHKRHIKAY